MLLEPFTLNAKLRLKNRILMAPMTRNLAQDDLVPTAAMADYYAKRAAAGLIITEGTIIAEDAKGYSNAPGIFTQSQIEGWKRVTDQVHAKDGHIFCQIWHVGRVSHPYFLKGKQPMAPSASKMSGPVKRSNGLFYGDSRALQWDEIQALVECYANAAQAAMTAGFDGVEIHGANGYLIDQFLHYDTNQRQDSYGGSPENMARFALEVVDACRQSIGSERVGLRLSPVGYLNEIKADSRDAEVFAYLLQELAKSPLAYLHSGNFDDQVCFAELGHKTMSAFIRSHYPLTLVGCGGYSAETAGLKIKEGGFDLVALGRPFIANPDLIERLRDNKSLQPYSVEMLQRLD